MSAPVPTGGKFRPSSVRMVSTTIRLPFDLLDAVMKFAEENSTSQSNALRFLVESGLLIEDQRRQQREDACRDHPA